MVITPTNQHDSPPLHLTLERPSHLNLGLGAELPETITVHPNASHDSRATQTLLEEIGCRRVISPRGTPLETGKRRPIERTHSRHNHGFKKLAHCTEHHIKVINAFITLTNTIIIIRQLRHHAWLTHRWDTRPTRRPQPHPSAHPLKTGKPVHRRRASV